MKVICIVQARMGSERLPRKVIRPIMGKPMILYTLDRLSKSRYIDELVLATSTRDTEEPLVQVCQNAGYNVFRGEEYNVLKRYVDTVAEYMNEDCVVVRVTGDCPLIDPVIVDNVLSYFLMNNFDYVRLDVPETFIRGFDVEAFTSKALYSIYDKVKCSNNEEYTAYKEHVTMYIYKHPHEYTIGYVKGSNLYKKDYRLCVDTPEDFKLVEKIYMDFNNIEVTSYEIVNFLDNNSEIAHINNKILQKQI